MCVPPRPMDMPFHTLKLQTRVKHSGVIGESPITYEKIYKRQKQPQMQLFQPMLSKYI